jgi:putative salt-induced outer membrane protein YdiY
MAALDFFRRCLLPGFPLLRFLGSNSICRRESMMKRQILILLFLAASIVCARAGSTNQIALPLLYQPLWSGGFNPFPASLGAPVPGIITNRPRWEADTSLGLTLTRGNSDTLLATATVSAHRNNLTNEWFLGLDGTYGENTGVENAEAVHGFGQYNHLFTSRIYGYMRADALHDGIADIVYRVAVSPGVGYYFIKTKNNLLAGSMGPGMVAEKLAGERADYMTLRLAERFEHKFENHARVWDYVEFLPQVDKPDNYLINAEAGVETPITKQFSLRIVFQDSFANIPAPGHKNNDLKLISGLAYKF